MTRHRRLTEADARLLRKLVHRCAVRQRLLLPASTRPGPSAGSSSAAGSRRFPNASIRARMRGRSDVRAEEVNEWTSSSAPHPTSHGLPWSTSRTLRLRPAKLVNTSFGGCMLDVDDNIVVAGDLNGPQAALYDIANVRRFATPSAATTGHPISYCSWFGMLIRSENAMPGTTWRSSSCSTRSRRGGWNWGPAAGSPEQLNYRTAILPTLSTQGTLG